MRGGVCVFERGRPTLIDRLGEETGRRTDMCVSCTCMRACVAPYLLVDGQHGELHAVEHLEALGEEAVPHAGHHLLCFGFGGGGGC